MSLKDKIALVTGATSGIGMAIAEILAENGCHLIITGRREDRLKRFSDLLQTRYSIKVISLIFDVRDSIQVNTTLESLSGFWSNIDILINNAGLASGLSRIDDGNIQDWDTMIDTNIKGVLYMLRGISPGMIQRKRGHIINISSVASKQIYPMGNVYCATKHALDAITQSMRMECVDIPIKISSIHPGMVETEFSLVRFHGDKDKADAVYKDYEPLYAEDIAHAVHYCLTRPSHVNIHEMIVMPSSQAAVRLMRKKLE